MHILREQLREAADGVQRRSQLVTHHGEEFRLGEIGFRRQLLGPPRLVEGGATFDRRGAEEEEECADRRHERLERQQAGAQPRLHEGPVPQRGREDGELEMPNAAVAPPRWPKRSEAQTSTSRSRAAW